MMIKHKALKITLLFLLIIPTNISYAYSVPSAATGAQVIPTIVGNTNWHAQTGAGLFDWYYNGQYNTNAEYYWYDPADFVEISIPTAVNIYRSGTTTWNYNFRSLKILKKNQDATYTDVSSTYTIAASAINEAQWEKFVSSLPAGTYKFAYNASTPYRIDSEWYLEEVTLDTAAPAEITGLSETHTGNSVSLSWINPVDADFNRAKVYRWNDGTGTWDVVVP
jgi:hypothetical protein